MPLGAKDSHGFALLSEKDISKRRVFRQTPEFMGRRVFTGKALTETNFFPLQVETLFISFKGWPQKDNFLSFCLFNS